MKRVRRSAKRAYESPARDAARAATREAIVSAAARVLRDRGWDGFSVEAVARAARVTRVTVYHQFDDRRVLLEAVFDAQAALAGLGAIAGAMAKPDPHEALSDVVAIFCAFWAASKPMRGVMAAAAADAQLGEAIARRNERRRTLLGVLVERMVARGDVAARASGELVDVLFALTSFAFWEALVTGPAARRAPHETIRALAAAAVARVSG